MNLNEGEKLFEKESTQIRTFLMAWMVLICIYTGNSPVHFLILNTFLAYIPIELSFLLNQSEIKNRFWFWPIGLIWLLFYPNTPYLLTDLIHLSLLNPYNNQGLIRLSTSLWISYTFLVISAFVCFLIGFHGLIKIAQILAKKLRCPAILLTVGLTLLSSIGVYIGRFLRIHTIYLFISPHLFITPLIHMWTAKMMIFTLLFTLVQLSVYWAIHLLSKDPEKED